MTLHEYFEKLENATRHLDPHATEVKVLSVYWSGVQNKMVSADVTGVGVLNETIYIEINQKIGDEEE
jgi:hypothetical protein